MQTLEGQKVFTQFKEEILEAVRDQVQITVNGKIDKIREHLNSQDLKLDVMDKKLTPLVEIKNTTTNLGKAVIWLGGAIIMVLTVAKLIK